MLQLHSSHSTWLFDVEGKRFKRVPSEVDPVGPFATASWEEYHDFVVEGDELTVILDDEGTRRLRARLRDDSAAAPTTEEKTQEIELQFD